MRVKMGREAAGETANVPRPSAAMSTKSKERGRSVAAVKGGAH